MFIKQLKRLSDVYYTKALSLAKNRDLTKAIKLLEISIEYNKSNIDARNLLGLIYFELGEVSQALVAWILSINIDADNDLAQYYIQKLQVGINKRQIYEKNIKKYNEALYHVNNDNMDLAISVLNRSLETNKIHINSALLLGLLYINKSEYIRADKILKKVLKIDVYNETALRYRAYISNFVASHIVDKKTADAIKTKDDVIIPNAYSAYTGLQTVVNIGIGLLIGAASILFIYMPTTKAKLKSEYNKSYSIISDKLSNANLRADDLGKKLDDLQIKYDRVLESNNTNAENINYKSLQYQKLLNMQEALFANEMLKVADIYTSFDATVLSDMDDGSGFSVSNMINNINNIMASDGSKILSARADELYLVSEFEKALYYYEKAIKLSENDLDIMLKKGKTLVALQRIDEANTVFSDIIINYPDSEQAKKAKVERGY